MREGTPTGRRSRDEGNEAGEGEPGRDDADGAKRQRTWVREVTALIKEPVAKVLNQDPKDMKLRWSQTAGCACGCSPGWIVSDSWTMDTVWVDVLDPEEQARKARTKVRNEIMEAAHKAADEAGEAAAAEARTKTQAAEAALTEIEFVNC